MARLPFHTPSGTHRIGGVYRIPAEEPWLWRINDPTYLKDRILDMLIRGMEAIVRQTEDLLRSEWDMESRTDKARREFEEECRRRFHYTFQREALGVRPLTPMERPLILQADLDDWPILGEVIG